MASGTYTTLLSDIQKWAQRSDDEFIATIPRFIDMAENILARDAKVLGYERYVISALQANIPAYAKPDRWRRTISIKIGIGVGNNTNKFLFPRDKTFLETYWPTSTETDEPEYYGDVGYYDILIAPTPNAAYPYQWAYYERPEPLSASVQQNWNTKYIYDVLLATCMLQATPYLKDFSIVPQWEKLFNQYIQASSLEDFRRTMDRTEGETSKGGN